MPAWLQRHRVTLLVVAAGVLWFLPALWWGLPDFTPTMRVRAWGPDELAPTGALEAVLAVLSRNTRALSPQYPLGQYLVQACFVWPYRIFVMAADNLGLPAQSESLRVLTLLHRLPSVLMAAGTVAAVRAAAARMADDARAGWIAAAAVATAGPVIYYARTSNVDAGALFWTALAMVLAVQALQGGLTVRRSLALGLCAAAGTATKDQQYAFFAGLALVVLASHLAQLRRGGATRGWWRAPLAGLAAAAALYLAMSGIVLLPRWFLGHVRYVLHGSNRPIAQEFRVLAGFYYSNPATLAGYARVAANVAAQLLAALGAPLIVLALGGAVHAARHERRLLALLALPPVFIFLGVIAPVRFVLPRFLLPVDLVLCCFAGIGLAAGWRASPRWRAATGLLAAAGIGWTTLRGVDLTVQMLRDARYQAGAWLARAVQPGDTVAYYGATLKLPALRTDAVVTPGPWQYLGAEPATRTPAFIVSVPQQITEPVHEWVVPDSTFGRLLDGSLGYRQVLAIQAKALFPRPLLVSSFVNPPVRVFARNDVAERLRDQVRVELPDPRPDRR